MLVRVKRLIFPAKLLFQRTLNMSDVNTPPRYFRHNNLNLKADNYKDGCFEQVYKLFQDSKTDSTGVGEDEFTTKDQLQQRLKICHVKVTIQDCDKNDKVVAFIMLPPSPLSRSREPLYSGIYTLVDKGYRGMGFFQELFSVSRGMSGSSGERYGGILGRMAISSRGILPSIRQGTEFCGFIPKSLRLPEFGWISDTIGYRNITGFVDESWKEKFIASKKKNLKLPQNKTGVSTMVTADVTIKVIITKKQEEVTLRGANRQEIQEVEEMARKCAQNGDGFNLDEFCAVDGYFLHKFILEPKVVVATDAQGTIKGSAIYGLSAIPRVPGAMYSAYFIVKESERRKSIGTVLLEKVKNICQEEGCDMLLDVYLNNQVAIEWLRNNGFLVTGCLPHCGYIVNHGYTDALLMYKNLQEFSSSNVISKI